MEKVRDLCEISVMLLWLFEAPDQLGIENFVLRP